MQDLETKWAMDHYGLDYDCGWVICRNAFPWAGRRRPVIKTLSVTMEQQSVRIPGPHFKLHEPGGIVSVLQSGQQNVSYFDSGEHGAGNSFTGQLWFKALDLSDELYGYELPDITGSGE